jgi:hypothetical protein
MADKITLATVSNPQNLTSLATTLNSNFAVIQTAFDNNLSRDGTQPDQMESNLDMNSNQILNLPPPATPNSPARLVDVNSTIPIMFPPVGTSGAVVGLLNTNKIDSGNDTFTGIVNFNSGVAFNGGVTFPVGVIGTSQIANGAVTSAQIATNGVSNSNLAQTPALTMLGNNTGSTANVQSLTVSQIQAMLGIGWSNTRSAQTAAYTVLTTDIGKTIALGGNAYYTVTLTAASGYPSNFVVLLLNEDTARAKLVSPNGVTSFYLYPGQSCFVFNDNNNWVVHGSGRWKKAGAAFFVDVNNGSDTNDGLVAGAGGAFKTINMAYNTLQNNVDCQGGQPTINIAAGTYTESVVIQSQLTGFNFVLFQGAGSSGVLWKPATNVCLLVGDDAECQVSGIKFDNSGGANNCVAISMHQTSVIDILTDINFGNFPGSTSAHISNDKGGYINLPASYIISGSAAFHVQVSSGCVVTQSGGGTVTLSNNTFTVMYEAILNSVIAFDGVVTYSGAVTTGTQKYSIDFLSCFSSNGSAVPGSVAGALGHGSQFS